MKNILFVLASMFLLLPGCKQGTPADLNDLPTDVYTVYLVRHAEKQKGDNPGLTKAGEARAEALKNRLLDKNIRYIHSSDYRRTLQTAAPLADALGLEVQIYDPRDLLGISDTVTTIAGNHLIVGHSNTTPQLAAILSAQVMDEMPETEYDRFIEVRLSPNGDLEGLNVSRYGAGPGSEK